MSTNKKAKKYVQENIFQKVPFASAILLILKGIICQIFRYNSEQKRLMIIKPVSSLPQGIFSRKKYIYIFSKYQLSGLKCLRYFCMNIEIIF